MSTYIFEYTGSTIETIALLPSPAPAQVLVRNRDGLMMTCFVAQKDWVAVIHSLGNEHRSLGVPPDGTEKQVVRAAVKMWRKNVEG